MKKEILPLKKAYIFIIVFFCTIIIINQKAISQPQQLQCEHLVNPIGIDEAKPRLGWKLNDQRQGAMQSAYHIIVGNDSLQVARGTGNMWQTGQVRSDVNLIVYEGKSLEPFTRYFWKVELWDKNGSKYEGSPVNFFETGMMNASNWRGDWIGDSRDIDLKPAPYFRKEFRPTKRVVSARAYVAAAGLFELFINGQRIGDHQLDPTYTRFDRRILYVTHDVTGNIQSGENAIGVILGNGWYNHQSTAVWYFHEAPWRARPAFCLDLHLKYDDGSFEVVSTDKSWKTSLGPIIFNSIFTAEHYDARLEQRGWSLSGFDDSSWKNSMVRPAPTSNIVAQAMQPVRHTVEILPKSIRKIDDRTWVYDIGRNISGVSMITLSGKEGTTIKLKHSEKIYPDGRADISNIDVHYRPTDDTDPFQTDIFIFSGQGKEKFIPRFNYKGFQYVEVTSSEPVDLDINNLKAYFMHSDVPPVGIIHSSNPTINKIWEATNNAYLSNLFGYPTDCPQREKNGWTGDAHIAIETALYNFKGMALYEKWMADHRDEQQPNGVLPAIIPTSGWGYHWANGPDWTSTIAIIPWNLYLFYGDKKPLADNYDNIKRYVDHINYLYPSGLTDWGLGDWVPVKSKASLELVSSIYYFTDAQILANAAKLLGHNDDHEKYRGLAEKIKSAINAKYLDRQTGNYASGFQTELSMPLMWGVVPVELISKVASRLAERVKADGISLDVGILGAKAILNALSENGHAELAYALASKETFPSWGWWIVNGATTLYENWDIDAQRDLSLNHIMFGEIGAWLFKAPGGIKPDPDKPGFKNTILKPHFVQGLQHFEASHDGPNGMIVSKWKRSRRNIEYIAHVPANSTATLYLKGSRITAEGKEVKGEKMDDGFLRIPLTSGKHVFIIRP
jgi:alpha-L-rhamnosidase